MLLLHVTYTVKEGQMENWLRKIKEIRVAELTRQEPGNLDYSYYRPLEGGNQILLVELWESAEAQQAHTQTAHFAALGEAKAEFVENTELKRYLV